MLLAQHARVMPDRLHAVYDPVDLLLGSEIIAAFRQCGRFAAQGALGWVQRRRPRSGGTSLVGYLPLRDVRPGAYVRRRQQAKQLRLHSVGTRSGIALRFMRRVSD